MTLLNNSFEFSSNLDKPVPYTSGIRTPSAHPILTELLSGSTGCHAGLQTSRLVQGKGSNPIKVLIKKNKVIYKKYISAKFRLVSYCH